MDQKIPAEILNRKEHALVSQAEMHITVPYDGPCFSFNDVYASFVHRLSPLNRYPFLPGVIPPCQFR
jgi:hypothetical protein